MSASQGDDRPPTEMYVYTLKLEGGKFYVGTTNSPQRRMQEHRDGVGSPWTCTHTPVGFLKLQRLEKGGSSADARLLEDMTTKRLMLKHGIDCVRGGSYTRQVLPREDIQALLKELWHAGNCCLRCGRAGHWAYSCYARTDVGGNILEDEIAPEDQAACEELAEDAWASSSSSSQEDGFDGTLFSAEGAPTSDDGCFRCGRPGHWIASCYARVHIDGTTLKSVTEESEESAEEDREFADSGPWPRVEKRQYDSDEQLSSSQQKRRTGDGSAGSCYGCGRFGHLVASCYAKTHVDGITLGRSAGESECWGSEGSGASESPEMGGSSSASESFGEEECYSD